MSAHPASSRSGRVAAVLVAAGAIAYGIAGSRIEYAFSSDPIGPRGFPVGLAILLVLLAVWYFVRPGAAESLPTGRGLAAASGFVGLALAGVLAMPLVGFVPTMTVLLAGVAWLFGARPVLALGSGLVQALIWWSLFGPLLGGNLPKGPLGI